MTDSATIAGINDSIRQRVLGTGYEAWKFVPDFDGLDYYNRTIPVVSGQSVPLTRANVEQMFRDDFGIPSVIVTQHEEGMLNVVLFANDGDALRSYGWGKRDLGLLQGGAPPPRSRNKPKAVLAEMVRQQVLEPKAWTESMKLATGHTKNAEFFLPADFITQLAQQMPEERSQEFHLKQAVRDAIAQQLPGVPIILYCVESEHGTNVRLAVKRENCAKLDEAIMAVKQEEPDTNVSNFQLARAQRLAQTTVHSKG